MHLCLLDTNQIQDMMDIYLCCVKTDMNSRGKIKNDDENYLNHLDIPSENISSYEELQRKQLYKYLQTFYNQNPCKHHKQAS